MDAEQMRRRTKEFAKAIIELCRRLPETREARLIGGQLFRAGTSVGANYRAVCRARPRAEFISKMGLVLEEADQTVYWLELLAETRIMEQDTVGPLMREANELVAIFAASLNTAKGNRP